MLPRINYNITEDNLKYEFGYTYETKTDKPLSKVDELIEIAKKGGATDTSFFKKNR